MRSLHEIIDDYIDLKHELAEFLFEDVRLRLNKCEFPIEFDVLLHDLRKEANWGPSREDGEMRELPGELLDALYGAAVIKGLLPRLRQV